MEKARRIFFNCVVRVMEFSEWFFLFAWFLAGFINAIAGMGAAMVAVPLVTPFMPPAMLTPVACIIVMVISMHMSWNFRKGCLMGSLKNMLIGAVPGSLVGLAMLVYIPVKSMQLFTGIVMVAFVIWQFARKMNTVQRPETLPKSLFAGFCSGVLNTSISFGNPPVGVYALYLGWTPLQTVGTTNIFSIFAYIFACVIQASAGLYTQEVLTWAAMGVPAAMLGIVCAMPVARRINASTFKRVLLVVIACGGLTCMWRGLSITL